MQERTNADGNGWPEWVDKHRYRVGGAIFVVFFALYGSLVYVSGQRRLTSLEQAATAAIGIVISASLGVVLAWPFAKRRIRIGSQLRRAYGICQTLKNTQANILEASDRMKARAHLDAKTTNEFWQEIATNIRTVLQGAILDGERIVQDWGEMDPDERARIEEEEGALTRRINELYTEIETARSVERDLAGTDVAASLRSAVGRLEMQLRTLQRPAAVKTEVTTGWSARALMNRGEYQKAVAAYDEAIRQYPTVHTNFIGRAKARYLLGDIPAALDDLSTAEKMFPSDPVINQFRAQIGASGPLTVPDDNQEAASVRNVALSNNSNQTVSRE